MFWSPAFAGLCFWRKDLEDESRSISTPANLHPIAVNSSRPPALAARPDWQSLFPLLVSARSVIDVQPGWDSVVIEALTALTELARSDTRYASQPAQVSEIRQKYGSMRIDTSCITEAIEAVVATAETKSLRTCEFCGRRGRPREHGDWIVTCCDSCATTRLGA